eukprot:m.64656 g.64656  ORF g.64656 m.64656 type:complete len:465 (-) comp8120_c0_seq2:1681-3075(-)
MTVLRNRTVPIVNGIRFAVGTRIDAQDYLYNWYPARIAEVNIETTEALIHFEQWSKKYDEWIRFDSPRLRPLISFFPPEKAVTSHRNEEVEVGDIVAAYWHDGRYYPAVILSKDAKPNGKVVLNIGFEDEHRTVINNILPKDIITGRTGRTAVAGVDLAKPPTYSARFPDPEGGSRVVRANKRTSPLPMTLDQKALCSRAVTAVKRAIRDKKKLLEKGPRSPPRQLNGKLTKSSPSSSSSATTALTTTAETNEPSEPTTSTEKIKTTISPETIKTTEQIPTTEPTNIVKTKISESTTPKTKTISDFTSSSQSQPIPSSPPPSLTKKLRSPVIKTENVVGAVASHSKKSVGGTSSPPPSKQNVSPAKEEVPSPQPHGRKKSERKSKQSSTSAHPLKLHQCHLCPRQCQTSRGLTMHIQYNHPEALDAYQQEKETKKKLRKIPSHKRVKHLHALLHQLKWQNWKRQ